MTSPGLLVAMDSAEAICRAGEMLPVKFDDEVEAVRSRIQKAKVLQDHLSSRLAELGNERNVRKSRPERPWHEMDTKLILSAIAVCEASLLLRTLLLLLRILLL